ncbi:MAG: mtnD [Myxococcales bacterium]|nr:mtnD [Myxococcales bacterium]
MSLLCIRPEDRPDVLDEMTREGTRIAALLRTIGVRFERWPADHALAANSDPQTILAAYAAELTRLQRDCGYQTADVVRIVRGTPDTAPMRQKFLNEHRHSEDEVRFFVEGSGSFYLRAGGRVFQVVCERDDLISVPAETRHWFDMGASPHFCAIRLFNNIEGWVARFTDDPIAARFPSHDEALALSAGP